MVGFSSQPKCSVIAYNEASKYHQVKQDVPKKNLNISLCVFPKDQSKMKGIL